MVISSECGLCGGGGGGAMDISVRSLASRSNPVKELGPEVGEVVAEEAAVAEEVDPIVAVAEEVDPIVALVEEGAEEVAEADCCCGICDDVPASGIGIGMGITSRVSLGSAAGVILFGAVCVQAQRHVGHDLKVGRK